MSKIILGIKDENRPMHILGFDGNYSIQFVDDPLSFHYYDRGKTKITLETIGYATEFGSSKEAINHIYGGRSGSQRELIALSFLEKSLGTNKDKFGISKVISHEPATIVFWKDGTKTVVKCQEGDTYDLEKGILYAIIRKVYGEGRNYTNILNIINESCETYDHEKANEAFCWNYGFPPVEDKPGYVWINKRNHEMAKIDLIKESIENFYEQFLTKEENNG